MLDSSSSVVISRIAIKRNNHPSNIMKLKNIIGGLLAVSLVAGSVSSAVAADKKSKLEKKAKITRVDAEKIALAKAPGGKIEEGELEEEGGKLVWSFDISTPGSKDITEVQVDAVSGAVVSVEKETPADQKKEKENDKKEKK